MRGFDIQFDNYSSTHSPENRGLCQQFWTALENADLLDRRQVTELFDAVSGESLPDRFVQGTCPNLNCHAPNQYGDNCDKCGATYAAIDLIDPVSTTSGQPPVRGAADHFFVKIESLHHFLEQWTQSGDHLQKEVANYLKGHFLHEPLRDWDVSRPAPYFGFDIPGTDGQHYWYVWFDAPIGYVASTQQCVQRKVRSWTIGGIALTRRFTISLARTFNIFTACFGRRCCRRPVSICPRKSTSTDF